MRRPPGLWILLSAGVVWLSLQNAHGLRATSLIFGKTTTTTTTTAKPVSEEPEAAEEETATTDLSNDPNATKPTLTGNPQLDYIWDPNLPQELNGYNLSDYPFYERVPEDIDFKCDGLHDGFYASVAHKCQVYHHCLFGTRYDFLCANYTAFDQKTFICHFASEVDCANSKKFWHRNDALYKAASTTTIKPFVIYTTAPPPPAVPASPVQPAALPPSAPGPRRPVGGRRRPFRRRRPQYDYYDDEYYDDYYEERPRANRGRKRPRPRPRPVYDDDYEEEYEDDRYQRRGGGSRREEERRPHDRRSGNRRRNKDRVKDEYEDEVADGVDDDPVLGVRRKPNDRKRPEDLEDERYSGSRKRRPIADRTEDEKPVPRKGQRRPVKDDYEDYSVEEDDSRSYERPRNNNDRRSKPKEDTRTIIKPVSGTIYDRPRVAPRIKLPVPKNEADKYAYKPVEAQPTAASQDQEEYYDDYEAETTPVRTSSKKQQSRGRDEITRAQTASQSRPRRPDPYETEDRPRSKPNRDRPRRPIQKDYYDDYEEEEIQRPSAVYHHCLFGTRYDFLCANYTAFDQTLFNCNFVSNVDCENSKKYWHRNDELYVEKSTTTVAPAINYNFYTPPPQGQPLTPSPVGAPPPPQAPASRRQAALRPRATRPPARPVYDYYDEYEELPRPKARKRPRPRPRPVYYDDYEEYDDLRITRRGGGRRRPYSRRERPMRRNKDRRKLDYEDDYVYEDDDLVLDKKEKAKRRKLPDDYEYEDDRRNEKRRPQSRREKPRKKLPIDDYDDEEDERFDRRPLKEENRRSLNDENKKIPRLGKRRPPSEEYEDDLQQADDPQTYDRPRKINRDKSYVKPSEDGRPVIKPVSGTIYDRPRVAPRINLPVPKNAADKYAYKPIGTPTTPVAKVTEEDYDDYEETAPQAATNDKKPASSRVSTSKVKEEDYVPNPPRPKPKNEASPADEKKTAQDPEDDYDDKTSKTENPANKATATTEPALAHSSMPVIRKFKRPFLPSRGGNPYSARNLQAVGIKANDDTQEIDLGESSVMKSVADPEETGPNTNEEVKDTKQAPLEHKTPSVTITTGAEESTLRSAVQENSKGLIRIKVPIRMKPYVDQDEPRPPYGNKYSVPGSTTTTEQVPLAKEDILNGNYDVTLNEAISPIIPNLPVGRFGGYNPSTDYSYKRFQRPTKYVILDPVVSAGSTYYVR